MLQCNGTEQDVFECEYNVGNQGCASNIEAAVSCQGRQ